MRDGAFPDCLEGVGAQPYHHRVIRQLVVDDLTIASEMVEPDELTVEDPEVIAREAEVRCPPPWQPAHLLTGGDVEALSDVVLEPDVVSERLGYDPRAPERDAPSDVGPYQLIPVRKRWLRGRLPR
jgi:hypothetical protein